MLVKAFGEIITFSRKRMVKNLFYQKIPTNRSALRRDFIKSIAYSAVGASTAAFFSFFFFSGKVISPKKPAYARTARVQPTIV